MCKYAAFIIAIAAWTTAAHAEPDPTPERADIAFHDIIKTLEIKLTRDVDQVFFETQVLKGLAIKTVGSVSGNQTKSYTYAYGPELAGKGSSYSEFTDGKSLSVHFFVDDFSQRPCLTFRQVGAELHSYGWKRTRYRDNLGPPDGESIRAAYIRHGVSLEISNDEDLMPRPEPFNSAEGNQRIIDEAHARMRERQNVKPGTPVYEALCVTSVNVDFTR